ncbi:MAG: hypothetical protein QG622_2955 [Actinomycetota bacterium]|nr:hypothetical protein [Actinomycetota bacterium]
MNRTATPYQAYLDLPDHLRAEYVGGVIIVKPPPSPLHQLICGRLNDLLSAALPRATVAVSVGWALRPDGSGVRVPDVSVLDHDPSDKLLVVPPLVVIEVLSANRSEDLVRKSTDYLDAGAGQYWIVDPRDRLLDAYLNTPTGWEPLAGLTDDNPTGTVEVSGYGAVGLDLSQLLP